MSKGRSNLQRDRQPMPIFALVTWIAHMLVETIQQMEKTVYQYTPNSSLIQTKKSDFSYQTSWITCSTVCSMDRLWRHSFLRNAVHLLREWIDSTECANERVIAPLPALPTSVLFPLMHVRYGIVQVVWRFAFLDYDMTSDWAELVLQSTPQSEFARIRI